MPNSSVTKERMITEHVRREDIEKVARKRNAAPESEAEKVGASRQPTYPLYLSGLYTDGMPKKP